MSDRYLKEGLAQKAEAAREHCANCQTFAPMHVIWVDDRQQCRDCGLPVPHLEKMLLLSKTTEEQN